MRIKAYPHRKDLYRHLPKSGVGAEIGVQFGINAEFLHTIAEPQHLYLVDAWQQEWGDHVCNCVKARFTDYESVEIVRQVSVEWANSLPAHHLDWVYLDSSHMYEATRNELLALIPKIKPGGMIAGHDLNIWGYWKSGVIRPVLECVQEGLLDVIAVTEDAPCPSFLAKVS